MLLLYAVSVALCWLLTRKFFPAVLMAVVVHIAYNYLLAETNSAIEQIASAQQSAADLTI